MPAAEQQARAPARGSVTRTNRAGEVYQPMKPGDRLWDDAVPGFYIEAGVRARTYKVVTRVKGRPGQIRHSLDCAFVRRPRRWGST